MTLRAPKQGKRVERGCLSAAAAANLEVEVIPPAGAAAAHAPEASARAHAATGPVPCWVAHVQVDVGPPRAPAEDGDVVAATAVIAGLDHHPVLNSPQRRAGRGEHVLTLMLAAAPVRAEACRLLAIAHLPGHGEDKAV